MVVIETQPKTRHHQFMRWLLLLMAVIPSVAFASPGSTNYSGCHYCRGDNCWRYGYRDGEYHCHEEVRLRNRLLLREREVIQTVQRVRNNNREAVRARRALERASAELHSAAPAAELPKVSFIQVETSNTIVVRPEDGKMRVVRLLGVEGPQEDLTTWRMACFARTSEARLKSYITTRSLSLGRPSGFSLDQDARLLRYVIQDGKDIGAKMIMEGYAFSDKDLDHPLREKYDQLENEAFLRQRGLWGTVCGYPSR